MTRRSALPILALAGLATACTPIGRPPEMTEIGSYEAANGTGLTAERVAIAVPAPESARYSYQSGSLWSTSPSGLLGDKRARKLGDILTITIDIGKLGILIVG